MTTFGAEVCEHADGSVSFILKKDGKLDFRLIVSAKRGYNDIRQLPTLLRELAHDCAGLEPQHASDCAQHNAPAYPPESCDCTPESAHNYGPCGENCLSLQASQGGIQEPDDLLDNSWRGADWPKTV